VKALRSVDLTVLPGEVHAVVGENGAGKSTLMRIIAGAEQPDAGELRWRGEPVSLHAPSAAIELGIAAIYQELSLVPSLSVAENVFLGHEPLLPGGFANSRTLERDAARVLVTLGVTTAGQPGAAVESLSVAGRQMVEIAKAVSRKASLLIMDEPTASLGEVEVRSLFDLIRRLRDRGLSLIYVSHRLEEVIEIADRITVMRDGNVVAVLPVAEAPIDRLIELMVGRELAAVETAAAEPGKVVLSARGIVVPPRPAEVSLEVRAGEILALWGLVGSGRSSLARALAGLVPIAHGELVVDGRHLRHVRPTTALDAGVVYLTEDRKGEGLMLDRSVRENMALASLQGRSAGGFVRRLEETRVLTALVERLRIRTRSLETPVRNLSGGNQQKTMLARALLAEPRVLIVDEPTRGIDVGSKAEIYQLLREIAAEGHGVIVVSSDLPEVLTVADRIAVVREGAIAMEVGRGVAGEDALLAAATPGRRVGTSESKRAVRVRWLRRGGAAAIVLFALWLVGASLSGDFRSIANQSNVLDQSAVLALLALGQSFVILTGGIDLSVGATLTASSVVCAVVMNGQDGNIATALLAAVGVGATVGLANGLLVQRLRLEPFIVTLGTAAAVQGLVLSWVNGPTGMAAPGFLRVASEDVWRLPVLGVAAICFVVVAGLLLRFHIWGRRIYAVGGDVAGARLSGLHVGRVQVAAYVLAGTLAGIAGIFALARFGAADPNAGAGLEFTSITAVIAGGVSFAGGRGTVFGALAGVGILALIANMLNQLQVQSYWQQVVTGLVILGAVAVYQRGRGSDEATPA
jgi:ABC-type sugar transport system ATPase subunit/ribose/xylose/arabinose/galactoside ABC-type transport system permease subunit